MMNHYKHLTPSERYVISSLLKEGFGVCAISRNLNRDKSTISREITRNSGLRGYRPKQANSKAVVRKVTSHKHVRFSDSIKLLVEGYLRLDWSPEQVSNYLNREHSILISTERIYQHIAADKAAGGKLYKHLRQSNRKRRKRYAGGQNARGELKNRRSIDERPDIVDTRSRVGDWEIDTVIGKNHKGALVTIVERKSRYTLIGVVSSRHSENVTTATLNALKEFPEKVFTITGDNGKEFAGHEHIAKTLNADFYFAHPYSSWERGLNENTNGLIRQYFPKKSSFEMISRNDLVFVMNRLNNRPRKCLGYKTPAEVFGNFSLPRGREREYIFDNKIVALTT